MTARLVLRGGELLDPSGRRHADVLIEDGTVKAVESTIDPPVNARVLDASGCWVSPGLVDLHSHLREPGQEGAETVETGARAAALGGYTAVVAMPNTDPPIDSVAVAREVLALGSNALCEVAVAGAITRGRAGEQLAPMAEMAAIGIRIFTDDGNGVQDGDLMRRALEYAGGLRRAGHPVILGQHCEDDALAAGGVIHEGEWSAKLGLPGIPSLAEDLMVFRDLALAELTGVPVHFLHLSTKGSIALVAGAKGRGMAVTCEVAPHHFTLTDAATATYDPNNKVNPPLRSEVDRQAVIAGIAAGYVDAIATDHAPHPPEAKDRPFDEAPPGMLGLETALSLAVDELDLTPERIFALLSWQPARIAGLTGTQGRSIEPGSPANLAIFDPTAAWMVDPMKLASKSRNTPYAGRRMSGRVRHTVLRGEAVVVDAEAQR